MSLGFHACPPPGTWMNDPHALLPVPGGGWRLFAQYRDDGPAFARTHWGRWESGDLLRWRFGGVAIPAEDDGWAYSGCVVADGGALRAWHTLHDPATRLERQAERVSGDSGLSWSAPAPALGPPEPNRRDPFAWRRGDGTWRLLLARPGDWHDPTRRGEAELWTSADGRDWRETGRIGPFSPPGVLWEVPWLIERGDGRAAFVVSTVDRRGAGAPCATACWTGRFDGAAFTPEGGPEPLDLGPDFYAAVPALGSAALIGWASSWDTARRMPWPGFAGGPLALPRALGWAGDKLAVAPLAALRAAFTREVDGVPFAGLGEAVVHGPATLTTTGGNAEMAVALGADALRAERRGPDWLGWSAEHPPLAFPARLELFVDGPLVELFAGGRALTAALPAAGPFAVSLAGAAGPLRWRTL